ncbi:MAG TPA: tRNA uridine(34) 5-carboxymethylaminomethyl modification radical SAM/GNAT enzyme Elp3 [Nanoarchaeota archaeon]|nr:tRNA uridine(34) 5-carboxymethylaminomethyl modification radical SAM/GNAT enzyme Elp3 [Nanoarchaeota archaeon]
MPMKELINEIISSKKKDKNRVEFIKIKWAKRHGRPIPLNSEILAVASKSEIKQLASALMTKPTRTLSGVSVVAVMTKPAGCVGRCTYCPTAENAPKSYTGHEPSTMRAIRNNYDEYKIVQNRLTQLHNVGHSTDKSEVIVQGGTFTWMPWDYQYEFIKNIFDAFNQHGCCAKNKPCRKHKAKTLLDSQKINETAQNRIISIIIETRPDYCGEKEIKQLLELGATRVELGLQSTYDKVLKKIKRGHNLKQTKDAIRKLRDAGFKVDLHMMLGLPGSTKQSDIKMFKILFEDEDLKPDGLKIYPCGVIKGSELYNDWKKGKFKPKDDKYIMEVLKEVKTRYIPPYCRIKRIMRDIPGNLVEAGYKSLNLRQMLLNQIELEGKKCHCIRCREVGQQYKFFGKLPKKIELCVLKYKANGGEEYFISFEDKRHGILLGFARLRLCKDSAFLRELHVYGQMIPIGSDDSSEFGIQHKGLGKKLLAKAEEITKQNRKNELFVLSGVGVRNYYRKLGYKKKDYYMIKKL